MDTLPLEIFYHICEFLTISDIFSFSLSQTKYKSLIDDQKIWKDFFRSKYNHIMARFFIPRKVSWKSLYEDMHKVASVYDVTGKKSISKLSNVLQPGDIIITHSDRFKAIEKRRCRIPVGRVVANKYRRSYYYFNKGVLKSLGGYRYNGSVYPRELHKSHNILCYFRNLLIKGINHTYIKVETFEDDPIHTMTSRKNKVVGLYTTLMTRGTFRMGVFNYKHKITNMVHIYKLIKSHTRNEDYVCPFNITRQQTARKRACYIDKKYGRYH